MNPRPALHALIYGSDAAPVHRVAGLVENCFPASRSVCCTNPIEASQQLERSIYDLVVLVLDEARAELVPVIDQLKRHATAMPVCLLIDSSCQQALLETLPNLDPDWEIGFYDRSEDAFLSRCLQLAISRHETRWERDHLQRAFQSSLLQYRSLFDEVPDLIFLCDRAGFLLDVNATVVRVFGLDRENVLNRPIFEAFGLRESVFQQLVALSTRGDGPIMDLEVQFRPPNGRIVHGLTHMIAHREAAGRSVQFQGVIKDISPRKILESQLRDSEDRYRTLYELGQIASNSLRLEEVANASLELICNRSRALGGLLLQNRSRDQLDVLAAVNLGEADRRALGQAEPLQIGRGLIGRWTMAAEPQSLDEHEMRELPPALRDWLTGLGARSLFGFPLGRLDLTVPAMLLLLPYSEALPGGPDENLLAGLTRSLEMGLNNCYHFASAREAETKYRELWEQAPAYFMSFLKGGLIFEVNQTATRALGYTLHEMIGRPFSEFLAPEDRGRFAAHHRAVVENGAPQSYEIRLRKSDDTTLVASIISEPLLNADGHAIGEKAVLYDITRDKDLEARLRDHSKHLERKVTERTHELTRTMNFLNGILEGATEYAIFGLDEAGTFVHFNRGAQLILHLDPEEMVGRRKLDHLLDLESGEFGGLPRLLEAVDLDGVLVREMVVRTGDDRNIIMHMTLNRLHDGDSAKLAYVGIARDITEQKELEDLLKVYTENLEMVIEEKSRELEQKHIELIQSSKLATLGEMATGIAHEMNQPLSGIRTRAQLLTRLVAKGQLDGEKISASQNEIITLVDRISRIIHHMRVFARQDEQPFGAFFLTQSIDGCLSLLSEQLRLHAIEVALSIQRGVPEILGEPSQLEQVLINLLGNARDAMDERESQLTGAEARGRYQKRLEIGLERASNHEVRLWIADNGVGMNESMRDRIFQPFWTTKPVGKGTGLGLSITYGIVAKHRGRIEVESRPGEGTTFSLYFPTANASRARHEARQLERPEAIKGRA